MKLSGKMSRESRISTGMKDIEQSNEMLGTVRKI